jgi:Holliday junction resolvase RusA-like endonuclease
MNGKVLACFSAVNSTLNLYHLPIPPSSNNQYILVRRGKKTYHVPSAELLVFRSNVSHYALQTRNVLNEAKKTFTEFKQFQIHCLFTFKRERLFTKQNTVKKLDVSNRLKALHDEVSRIIGIDDSQFFEISATKRPLEPFEGAEECVKVTLFPLYPADY